MNSVELDVHVRRGAPGDGMSFVDQTAGVDELDGVECATANVTLVSTGILSNRCIRSLMESRVRKNLRQLRNEDMYLLRNDQPRI